MKAWNHYPIRGGLQLKKWGAMTIEEGATCIASLSFNG